MELHRLYHPLAAAPFTLRQGYLEQSPTPALAPYIRCFWEIQSPTVHQPALVNPDTCMDILFLLDLSRRRLRSTFCGVNDRPYWSSGGSGVPSPSTRLFAIRFYAWTVQLFSEESMLGVVNLSCDAEIYFSSLQRFLEPVLLDNPSTARWITAAESWLLRHIRPDRQDSRVLNAICQILQRQGRVTQSDLARTAELSSRQLERLFQRQLGLSPKKFSDLVRYQSLWRSLLFSPSFHVLDAVDQFGYTDQSHLLRDFKKYHGLTPADAKSACRGNVVFLQDPVPLPVLK